MINHATLHFLTYISHFLLFNILKGSAESTLAAAAEKGNVDKVIYVLEKRKANIEYKDNSGFSPLHLASDHGHSKVVEVLCQKKADIENPDKVTKLELVS